MGIFEILKKCWELLLSVKISYRSIKKTALPDFDAILIFAMKLKIGHVFDEKSKNEFFFLKFQNFESSSTIFFFKFFFKFFFCLTIFFYFGKF